jgi:hypothetical protein
MSAPRSAALALVAGLLCASGYGCAGDDVATDAAIGVDAPLPAEWLEIGKGFDRFEPYAEPATAELIAGPQGGFHLWTSLRARNAATTMSPLVSIEYERVRDGAIVSYPFRVRLSFEPVAGTDAQEVIGLRPEALTDVDVLDEDVVIRARVETRDGSFTVAERRVHVVRSGEPPIDGGAGDAGDDAGLTDDAGTRDDAGLLGDSGLAGDAGVGPDDAG